MAELGHVHDYKGKTFIDGCHTVVIEKTCKSCGAVHHDVTPRDFRLNPMQIAFADPGCERCRQMVKGMEPASWHV